MQRKESLMRFMGSVYGKGFASGLALIFLCAAAASAAQFMFTYYLGVIIDAVGSGAGTVLRLFAAICAAVVIATAGSAAWGLLSGRLANRFLERLRTKIGEALCHSEYAELERIKDGDLISIATNDAERYRPWLGSLANIGFIPVKFALSVACLFLMSWKLSLGAVLFLPLAVLPSLLLSKRLFEYNTAEREAMGRATGFFNSALDFIVMIKAFCLEQSFLSRNRGLLTDTEKIRRRRLFREQLIQTFGRCLGNIMNPLIFVIGAALILRGEMTIGQIMVVMLLAGFVGEALNIIYAVPTSLQEATAVTKRMMAVLDMKREEEGGEGDERLPEATASPCIEARNVSFTYGAGKALTDINLSIREGEKVAVVGASGSGKTTLLKLLCGLYRPSEGRILLRGTDTARISRAALRRMLAVAPQESFLFGGTVRGNVGIARPGASPEAVEQACRKAAAHGFVSSLGRGYETEVGGAGRALSKGQMQRLNLARAFLKDAPVLLLDEPTSALDADARKAVMNAILDAAEGKTVIVILHALPEPERFDRILVMENGAVAGFDSHDGLIRSNDACRALYAALSRPESKECEGA